MKLGKTWGIKERAIFLALAPAIVIAAALTVYFLVVRYADVEEALQNRGNSLVRQLAPAAEYGTFSGNRAELLRLVQTAAREPDVVSVSIYDASGQLLASAGNPGKLANTAADDQPGDHNRAIEVFRARISRPILPFDDPFQAVTPIPDNTDKTLGTVVVELSRADLDARKHEILGVTLLATFLVMAVSSLLALRLGRDITEPVLALENAVGKIRAGKLDVRTEPHPSGTLVSLETGFNEMAAALADSHRRSASALAQSEAELALQLNFAQTLLNAQSEAGIGLMIIEHGKIVFANHAVESTFGYTVEEIIALPSFLAVVHPDDRMRLMEDFQRRLRGDIFHNHYDFAVLRRNGEQGFADLTVATLPAGDHLQLLCVIVDITERKRAETRLAEAHGELLIKKNEAERVSEDKSRFLAAASHDLRQPLHALTLFATELAASITKPRNRKLASQIVTAAGAMAELLDALLDVARLDVAALQPQRRPVALGPLLETIADAHVRSASAKGLRLNCRSTQLWADTDPHLLRRMVGNLIANAVRYAHRGGVLVGARVRGDAVRIEVWDSGIGIDNTHLPYLFNEFYQVGNQERDAAKGLGLGLAIVARLGQILDHPVTVRSTPGRGSVFAITLPRAEPTLHAAAEPPSAAKPKLLVCHPDRARCAELCEMLDSWGYEHLCVDGVDEVPRLLEQSPALMLCDVRLLQPVADYLSVMAAAPLLVVLGESKEQTAIKIDGQLPMPLRPARLRTLLHHLLMEQVEEATTGT
jgi:two-component system, sensor histidine kinase